MFQVIIVIEKLYSVDPTWYNKGKIKPNMVFYHLQMLPQVCVDGAIILKLLQVCLWREKEIFW